MTADALPESDDPFELLGVPREASELDVRRAYVRLIRIWRPDQHPSEFQRIQRAYEVARSLARGTDGATRQPGRTSAAQADDEKAPRPESIRPEESARITAAWSHAPSGNPDQTAELLLRLANEQGTVTARTHAFLAEELASGFAAAVETLVHEATSGSGPALEILAAFSEEAEVRKHAHEGAFAIGNLGEHASPSSVRALFTARVDAALRRQRIADLAQEVESSAFRRAAEDDPLLQHQAHRLAAGLAWQEPDRATSIFSSWPGLDGHEGDAWMPADHFAVAQKHGAAYRKWLKDGPAHPLLARLVEQLPLLSAEAQAELGAELPARGTEYDAEFCESIFALVTQVPDLAGVLEVTMSEAASHAQVPAFDLADHLPRVMRPFEKRLQAGTTPSKLVLMGWAVIAGIAIAVAFWNIWAAIGTGLLLLWLFQQWMAVRIVFWLYKRRVRPIAAELVHTTLLHPQQLETVLTGAREEFQHLSYFAWFFASDPALRIIWLAQGIADLHRFEQMAA